MLIFAGAVLAVAVGRWTAADSSGRSRTRVPVPADVSGHALVLDGDTIDIRGVRVRLFGIDAPERDQPCKRADGSGYACGQYSRDTLVELIGTSPVTCTRRDVDRYGRMVGVCTAGAVDLGEVLVARGAAMAYRHFSRDYVDEEGRAQKERIGMWQGTFQPPWDYRHKGRTKHSR